MCWTLPNPLEDKLVGLISNPHDSIKDRERFLWRCEQSKRDFTQKRNCAFNQREHRFVLCQPMKCLSEQRQGTAEMIKERKVAKHETIEKKNAQSRCWLVTWATETPKAQLRCPKAFYMWIVIDHRFLERNCQLQCAVTNIKFNRDFLAQEMKLEAKSVFSLEDSNSLFEAWTVFRWAFKADFNWLPNRIPQNQYDAFAWATQQE